MIGGASQADVGVRLHVALHVQVSFVLTLDSRFLSYPRGIASLPAQGVALSPANVMSRKGEYETGFEKGGQTREHAM